MKSVWKTWKSGIRGTGAVSPGLERDFLYHPKKQALVKVVQNGQKSGKLTPCEGRDITQRGSSGRILYHTLFGIIWYFDRLLHAHDLSHHTVGLRGENFV